MIIETEHLIIRDFQEKDAVGLLEYLSHPRVNCFVSERLCSEESALAYISNTPKELLRYAVCLKEDDFIIGDVFALREEADTFNVGWHFNQRFEGKGLAHEAATEFLDYLFREAGARRIYGFVEDDNLRSKRLCERLGMRYEGCMKEFISFVCHPDGTPRYEDTCIYNPQIQISAESETKRSIFREKDKTKRSKKESAQHSKSRNKSFVMTSVSAL